MTRKQTSISLISCLLLVPLAACDAEDDAVEVLEDEGGRISFLVESPAAALEMLERADAGEIEVDPAAMARLREHIGGLDPADDDSIPRNLPACPNTNATASTGSVSFGIWGMQYTASAAWKKIGFGPHRPVRAEVTVCGPTGCVSDIQTGTPLSVAVGLLVPIPEKGPVYASARIIDTKNDAPCIAASSFQFWPGL